MFVKEKAVFDRAVLFLTVCGVAVYEQSCCYSPTEWIRQASSLLL